MGLVIAIVLIALILGGIGLVVEALWWLLVIAAIVFVAGLILGFVRRSAEAGARAGRGRP
jgi:hypothetical protein